MAGPRRTARPRRATVTAVVALVVAAVLAAGLAVALVVRTSTDTAAARRAAETFSAPPVTTPSSRIVSVVGDELTLPPNGQDPAGPAASSTWPLLLGQAVDARVFVVDSGGSYSRPAAAGGPTFVNHGGEVAPAADVVVFFGGRADEGVARDRLLDSAMSAYAAATATAPNAALVVIGPVPMPGAVPTADLLAVRDTLRTAVRRTHATFVDPIAQGWFSTGSGWFARNGELTQKGERRMADYVRAAVQPRLD